MKKKSASRRAVSGVAKRQQRHHKAAGLASHRRVMPYGGVSSLAAYRWLKAA